MNRWLVDGMNVIGSRPDRWWTDRDRAIRDLTRDLETYASLTREAVTIVFDYGPRELAATPGVQVRFPDGRGRNAADDLIEQMVSEDPSPSTLRVVTSDSELQGRVLAHGARVVSAGSFRREVDEVLAERR